MIWGCTLSPPLKYQWPERYHIICYQHIHLVEVDHDVSLEAHAADHVLQSQSVVDPRCVRHIQVVGFILVPLLHGGDHAVLICADHMQLLVDAWDHNDQSGRFYFILCYVLALCEYLTSAKAKCISNSKLCVRIGHGGTGCCHDNTL